MIKIYIEIISITSLIFPYIEIEAITTFIALYEYYVELNNIGKKDGVYPNSSFQSYYYLYLVGTSTFLW